VCGKDPGRGESKKIYSQNILENQIIIFWALDKVCGCSNSNSEKQDSDR
jgi:hypothetical protein